MDDRVKLYKENHRAQYDRQVMLSRAYIDDASDDDDDYWDGLDDDQYDTDHLSCDDLRSFGSNYDDEEDYFDEDQYIEAVGNRDDN